uniref:Uncharacterized protein n=1 Tax=Rhizophora mucronata TaxID=61149 RepID=A0A2P2QUK2_RHIMU
MIATASNNAKIDEPEGIGSTS